MSRAPLNCLTDLVNAGNGRAVDDRDRTAGKLVLRIQVAVLDDLGDNLSEGAQSADTSSLHV
jgi:hypothetical protein